MERGGWAVGLLGAREADRLVCADVRRRRNDCMPFGLPRFRLRCCARQMPMRTPMPTCRIACHT